MLSERNTQVDTQANNVDAMKEVVPYTNIGIMPCFLECVHARSNIQWSLWNPGSNFGLPSSCW